MRKILIFSVFILLFLKVGAQQYTFSDSTVVSLITCAPGEEVYTKFGHTGIRLNDPVNHHDVVFNYGIFSFNTKDFYYKFVKGETYYMLGVYPYNLFIEEYILRQSSVWEQKLQLTLAEKRQLIHALVENYQPQNRYYLYNFVFDNCATRPRDQILNALNGDIKFKKYTEPKTFRKWIGMYAGDKSWLKFGLNVIFGRDADKKATQFQSMFLPLELRSSFEKAEITDGKNEIRPLVSSTKLLVDFQDKPAVGLKWYEKPLNISLLILLFIASLTFFEVRIGKHFMVVDSLVLAITGLAGIIVAYLMFFSIHPLMKDNLNILWLEPLNIIAAILIWFKSIRRAMDYYIKIHLVFLVGVILAALFMWQVFSFASFPLIAALMIRYFHWKREG